MRWAQPMSFSKLLLVYDDAATDIGFNDVLVTSSTAPYFTSKGFGPLFAAGQVVGTGGPPGSATVAAIPEPSASAMLAFGLLGLGFLAWRRTA
jgi:hypothetical protein